MANLEFQLHHSNLMHVEWKFPVEKSDVDSHPSSTYCKQATPAPGRQGQIQALIGLILITARHSPWTISCSLLLRRSEVVASMGPFAAGARGGCQRWPVPKSRVSNMVLFPCLDKLQFFLPKPTKLKTSCKNKTNMFTNHKNECCCSIEVLVSSPKGLLWCLDWWSKALLWFVSNLQQSWDHHHPWHGDMLSIHHDWVTTGGSQSSDQRWRPTQWVLP